MAEEIYLVLPGCDDSNRGDQALIWETVELARTAGHIGKYYMLADNKNCVQSSKKGIENVEPILIHPSEHFKTNDNEHYSLLLKLKWGIAAVTDFIVAEPLVHPTIRKILLPLYPKRIKKRITVFQNAKASFVKGGGFLHSYGGVSDIYKIYYFLYHIRLAQSFGMKVYVLPNSFGPFKAPLVSHMIKSTLKKCECVMARESISKQIVEKECGVSVYKYPDIAFFINEDTQFSAQICLMQQGIPVNKKECVGITMRPYRFEGMKDGDTLYEQYTQGLADCITWLSRQGYLPVIIEHVYSTLEHENDMSCIEKVVKKLGDSCEYRVFADRSLDCEQLKAVYGCLDYLIGTRFHSVIFSLSQGVPCLAITYGGNKGDGIMRDLDLDRYSVPIADVSGDVLVKKFQELVGDREKVKKQIGKKLFDTEKEKMEIIEHLR